MKTYCEQENFNIQVFIVTSYLSPFRFSVLALTSGSTATARAKGSVSKSSWRKKEEALTQTP